MGLLGLIVSYVLGESAEIFDSKVRSRTKSTHVHFYSTDVSPLCAQFKQMSLFSQAYLYCV